MKFLSSTEFLTGTFLGFALTALFFTVVLTQYYVSRDLLDHSGFYRENELYYCKPAREFRGCKGRE